MTFTANQRLTIVLHVLAAVALAFLLGYSLASDNTDAKTDAQDSVLFDCETLDVSENTGHTDDYIALLTSAGWHGIAGDGAERLYSPAC